jgi:hypothetical protein
VSIAVTADGGESAFLNGDLGDDGVPRVHGHDLAVGEMKIMGARATGVLRVENPDSGCYDK